jgi:hypothetical protein
MQILDNIGSLPLGDFNETVRLLFVHAHTDVPGFVEKYPNIKYAISDRPHWRQHDLCETYFFITEWIALKLKILTDRKIRSKKNQTFSESAQVPRHVRQN